MHRIAFATLVLCAIVCSSSTAAAFCGYFVGSTKDLYNDATQVVLMRDGMKTVTTMRPKYRGPVANFAMVIPVPQVLAKDDVRTLSAQAIDTIDTLTSPRLVEYEEMDPCMKPVPRGQIDSLLDQIDEPRNKSDKPSVRVAAKFERGEYDIVILDANDSTALEDWLNKNGYEQPPGASKALAPYIAGGFYFFAAKVNIKRVLFQAGGAVLSPIQFKYTSKTFQLPIRLGLVNAKGKQDLVIFVLARDRVEVANRPNVFIPTNLDLPRDQEKRFAEWYDELFVKQLAKDPTAIVTEYAWPVAMKCDPCPDGLTALSQRDLDELGGTIADIDASQFTVTRLHARYDAKGGTSDLVFQSAKPVIGGREVRDADGKLEAGATPSKFNNFQGRYAIRRPWKGPIECKEPVRNQWTYQVRFTPRFAPAPPPAANQPATALSRTDVKQTIARYDSRLKLCASKHNVEKLSGTAKIQLWIRPDGSTTRVALVSPKTFEGTDVGDCITAVFGNMKFPQTGATRDIKIVYPIRVDPVK